MKTDWIDVNDRLPVKFKNVLVTINYDNEVHIAYMSGGIWKIWVDDELELDGSASINNTIDDTFFGVIAWMELPIHAEWKIITK